MARPGRDELPDKLILSTPFDLNKAAAWELKDFQNSAGKKASHHTGYETDGNGQYIVTDAWSAIFLF